MMALLLAGCSTTKFVDEGSYLLQKNEVRSDTKKVDAAQLVPYLRQVPNSKWFSTFKVPLAVYSLAGRDTSKRFNRFLQRIGEKPVIYNPAVAQLTCEDLRTALQNMGYMKSNVEAEEHVSGKKMKVVYQLHTGEPYLIRHMTYDIQDERIASLLEGYVADHSRTWDGKQFAVADLEAERKQITSMLMDNGYYRFHKDFISYVADTVAGSREIDLTMRLKKYRATGDSPETHHPCYTVRNVNFQGGDPDSTIHLRRKVLEENTLIEAGQPFSASNLQRTYNNFGRLQAVRFTSIRFNELPDTTLLDCNIQLSTNKPSIISFQPEGTNTAGDLGAAASLTYENRNLFHGSETFSVQLRGAFEAITGLEGYQNQNYKEYSLETKLAFPRFVAPFLSRRFRRHAGATSELTLTYDMQNRPEFHRRVFSAGWHYRWTGNSKRWTYKFDLIDMDYVHMPWISSTFKSEYLDNVNSRNAILRYNYEDLFIMKIGLGTTYNDGRHAVKANIETAGNLLNTLSSVSKMKKNDEGQHTLFNIAFAQYLKGDIDLTKVVEFDRHNSLAMHMALGVAYPYGNSYILPFEKRYFSGGANSVRGWSVRSLGPGKFKGSRGAIDFINQTGDMKLDMNLEYRTFLFWKLNGAFFVDAGNIWTLRNYPDQPGGQFKFDEFYKQIAVAYGLGFRLNFGYFVLRFDLGMKAVNPAYETQKEHWAIIHPDFSRDFSFHFAVGLPF